MSDDSLVSDQYVCVIRAHTNSVVSIMDVGELSPGVWCISRVKVADDYQGKGVGKSMVAEALTKCARKGAKVIQVCPGGYNEPPEKQRAFYVACGFTDNGPEMPMTYGVIDGTG